VSMEEAEAFKTVPLSDEEEKLVAKYDFKNSRLIPGNWIISPR